MSFATLALVMVIGLAGPLLAIRQNWHVPVVLGELAAGAVFGATGFAVLDATEPTFAFLGDVGFALTMFVAGTHVPVRDPAVRGAIGKGAARAVTVGVLAAVLGWLLATAFDTGHAALYAVLLASSSAALALPIVDSLGLRGTSILELTAQVAIADTACIVALPLVIDSANAGKAALGAVAVSACAAVLFFVLRYLEGSGLRRKVHELSEERKFAIELRVSLAVLFALAALATSSHVSIMLAGFSFGLAVAGIGEPRRVARQLFAINDGFLGPLFFVWLGSKINLREFGDHPVYILLGLALGFGAVATHAATRFLGQPLPLTALAATQLGVPVAAVTVGTQLHLLEPGEPAALILGALVTMAVAGGAGALAAKKR
ncbi:cation:proton antiporter [Antrihabitans stalactiti]|uniref:Cation:proton antiporter n=1 Tax=Antrihabitans stalactiti TaxID=2584121 RepID=A0A848KEP1_9NOCA|nr:cation:proton antiporter [Antrihabitans stalactiti]NMN95604.1 cation:proton antiporter [Antrihabitans stalactiti]